MFPQKKNPGIQATHKRLSKYLEMLYFKAIYTIYFCTFDINTTVSTCSDVQNLSIFLYFSTASTSTHSSSS